MRSDTPQVGLCFASNYLMLLRLQTRIFLDMGTGSMGTIGQLARLHKFLRSYNNFLKIGFVEQITVAVIENKLTEVCRAAQPWQRYPVIVFGGGCANHHWSLWDEPALCEMMA